MRWAASSKFSSSYMWFPVSVRSLKYVLPLIINSRSTSNTFKRSKSNPNITQSVDISSLSFLSIAKACFGIDYLFGISFGCKIIESKDNNKENKCLFYTKSVIIMCIKCYMFVSMIDSLL